MKTVKISGNAEHQVTAGDVDALLAAISAMSEGDIGYVSREEHWQQVSVDRRDWQSCKELADAFELDMRDVSVNEINR